MVAQRAQHALHHGDPIAAEPTGRTVVQAALEAAAAGRRAGQRCVGDAVPVIMPAAVAHAALGHIAWLAASEACVTAGRKRGDELSRYDDVSLAAYLACREKSFANRS